MASTAHKITKTSLPCITKHAFLLNKSKLSLGKRRLNYQQRTHLNQHKRKVKSHLGKDRRGTVEFAIFIAFHKRNHNFTVKHTTLAGFITDHAWNSYESSETRETNSSVTRPLDLVLITKCSGYFLNNISKPCHGFPLASGLEHSSDVRYLLTRL